MIGKKQKPFEAFIARHKDELETALESIAALNDLVPVTVVVKLDHHAGDLQKLVKACQIDSALASHFSGLMARGAQRFQSGQKPAALGDIDALVTEVKRYRLL